LDLKIWGLENLKIEISESAFGIWVLNFWDLFFAFGIWVLNFWDLFFAFGVFIHCLFNIILQQNL